jgi:hypothetical protein
MTNVLALHQHVTIKITSMACRCAQPAVKKLITFTKLVKITEKLLITVNKSGELSIWSSSSVRSV